MSAVQVLPPPLLNAISTARDAISDVSDAQPVYLRASDKQAALVELAALSAQVEELRLRVLAAADDVAEEAGQRDAAAWLAHATHSDRRITRADLQLARALDSAYERVAAGMRDGAVNRAQAQVIVHAVDALPAEIDPQVRLRAQRHLVQLAADHDPNELRRLGRHILDVAAPEAAEEAEARALEREEQRARAKTSLRLRPQGDGTTRIAIVVPDQSAARFETYLDAFTSPRKQDDALLGEEDRIPRHRRLGHAFCALLEHLDPASLPDHGGDATTVVVTIDHDKLTADLATAGLVGGLDGDLEITATQARRLACTAQILPAVLDGKGEVLDLGRTQRLFTPGQRKALRIRDRHCRADGCSIPATWCEAHHRRPWSRGGYTDLTDGVLFCNFHHHRAHDPRYTHDLLPNGDYRFHRRT